MFDVIVGMVKTDELDRVGNRLNQIIFSDGCRHDLHLPFQTGLRFSANAAAPSCASSEVKICATRGRGKSNMSACLKSPDSVDRKSAGKGKRVCVRVDSGGTRYIKKKNKNNRI